MVTLADLEPGQSGVISRIQVTGPIGQRLCEMGLLEGSPVEMIRRAPLGDPLEIKIQDYLLSLRKTEALLIQVDPSFDPEA